MKDQVILAIDPGPDESAYCYVADSKPLEFAKVQNLELRHLLSGEQYSSKYPTTVLIIEKVESFGMPVGESVFETVFWSGRFAEAWGGEVHRVGRKDVKLHLCGNVRAKDSNIRQALLDRYPRTGGGKTPQIGTKSQPGPLYGMAGDCWSALAVGLTYLEAS